MKRIVNVGLSVMAVTMMTFMMSACGSKEKETITVDLSVFGKNAEDTQSLGGTDAAPSNDMDPSGSTDGMTVDEWVNSEEAVTFVKAFNSVYAEQGITMEVAAENGTLTMMLIYSEEALGADTAGLTEEQWEEVHTSMLQQYNKFKDQLVSSGNVLKEEVDASVIHIVYKTSNGMELFSQDI
ncbi:MAG: DUF4854 domain-containing protein [Lachnospiraceae bacterium]|nr:DUF4854 domain-containing protein [Lachnospiraceae bacterium]